MEAKMEIKNLNKAFGDKIIFNNLCLTFPNGKISFIMGESGCGKTTLLKIIAGIDKKFDGEIIKESDFISYVFQEPRLFSAITVRQNIEIVPKGTTLTVEEILKIVELEGEDDSYPDNLSGGMKMRVALARALYHNGDIFLMDEPFSALDERMKERIIPRIFALLKGKTIVLVSHDSEDAEKYADEIIEIKKTLT